MFTYKHVDTSLISLYCAVFYAFCLSLHVYNIALYILCELSNITGYCNTLYIEFTVVFEFTPNIIIIGNYFLVFMFRNQKKQIHTSLCTVIGMAISVQHHHATYSLTCTQKIVR